MSSVKDVKLISAEEYLESELSREVKYEYVNGYIYAMAGATENHVRILGNIYRKLGNHLENSLCEPFISDMKIKTPAGNFRYPDCMVVCEEDNENDYYN